MLCNRAYNKGMGLFDKFFNSSSSNDTNPEKTSKPAPNSNACPSCGAVFAKPPKRKITCPECKTACYVRSKQSLFNSDLLTEEQMLASDFYSELMEYGATVDDYKKMEDVLAQKWGFKPNPYDVVWGVSNHFLNTRGLEVTNQEQAIQDMLHRAKMIAFSQAKYQAKRGKDPSGYLASVANYEKQIQTHYWKPVGVDVKEFQIETYNCCDACNKYKGKKYTAEYLKKHDVLPIKECTYKFDKSLKYGWCTCTYQAVTKL